MWYTLYLLQKVKGRTKTHTHIQTQILSHTLIDKHIKRRERTTCLYKSTYFLKAFPFFPSPSNFMTSYFKSESLDLFFPKWNFFFFFWNCSDAATFVRCRGLSHLWRQNWGEERGENSWNFSPLWFQNSINTLSM